MKLERKDFGGAFDYRVASDTATGQQIDFYHDLETDESWYVYRIISLDISRITKTLDEAIELWNKQQ
jgi:hypothetical protein